MGHSEKSLRFGGMQVKIAAIFALCALVILAASFFMHASPFMSPEVKFTDASKSGLAIVPASCPSNPDYAGQCSGTPPSTTAKCALFTSSYTVNKGQAVPLYWNVNAPAGIVSASITNVGAVPNTKTGEVTVYPTVTTNYAYSDAAIPSWSINNNSTCDLTITVSSTPVPPPPPPNNNCPAGQFSENGSCVGSCDVGYTQEGTSCVFTGCPAGYQKEGSQCIFSACPLGYTQQGSQCVFTGCTAGYICQDGDQYSIDANCNISTNPTQMCQYGCAGGACSPPLAPEIATWIVKPVLVKSGETTSVQWSSEDVVSCAVTGSNGDSWTGTSGTQVSSPIVAQTIYTITCQGLPGADPASAATSTTVNIVPNFNEQ